MPFECRAADIPDVLVITPKFFPDNRGTFAEIYKFSDFVKFGIREKFVQVNLSESKKNVVRGLHYQIEPAAQGKLVQAVAGEIFDVAVDIRSKSPTFGKWTSINLSDKNNCLFYIPPGFAHGFAVLSDTARVIYYCTAEYAAAQERGIIYNDSALNIDWPVADPVVSEKDLQFGQLTHRP